VFPERGQFDISCIPKIFLQANLDLSHVDTFKAVYQFSKDPQSPISREEGVQSSQRSEKLLQEKVGATDVIEGYIKMEFKVILKYCQTLYLKFWNIYCRAFNKGPKCLTEELCYASVSSLNYFP
jgi:hypothetical protein